MLTGVDNLFNEAAANNPNAYTHTSDFNKAMRLGSLGVDIDSYAYRNNSDEDKRRIYDIVKTKLEQWRVASIGDRHNTGYVDTTTLATVESLTAADCPITPSTILDLAAFVNCAVINERICRLPNPKMRTDRIDTYLGKHVITMRTGDFRVFDTSEYLTPDVISQLPAEDVAALWLHSLYLAINQDWANLRHALESDLIGFRRGEAEAIFAAWQKVIGRPLDKKRFFSPNIHSDWGSDTAYYMKRACDTDFMNSLYYPLKSTDEALYHFIDEANLRARFNLEVSHHLNLSYFPSAYRSPYQRAIYGRATAAIRKFPLIAAIDSAYASYVHQYSAPGDPELSVPFFLSAILARISKPSEIPEAIAELRDQTRDLRNRKEELEQAIKARDPKEIKQLKLVLSGEYRRSSYALGARMAAAGFLAILPLVSATIPDSLVPVIFLLAAHQTLSNDDLDRLIAYAMRPTWLCLSDVAGSARQSLDSYPRIAKIWGLDEWNEKAFTEGIGRFGAV